MRCRAARECSSPARNQRHKFQGGAKPRQQNRPHPKNPPVPRTSSGTCASSSRPPERFTAASLMASVAMDLTPESGLDWRGLGFSIGIGKRVADPARLVPPSPVLGRPPARPRPARTVLVLGRPSPAARRQPPHLLLERRRAAPGLVAGPARAGEEGRVRRHPAGHLLQQLPAADAAQHVQPAVIEAVPHCHRHAQQRAERGRVLWPHAGGAVQAREVGEAGEVDVPQARHAQGGGQAGGGGEAGQADGQQPGGCVGGW